MNTYDRLKELTIMKNMSIRQLELKLGYSNGYFAKWKNSSPNSKSLSKVADFFGVSTDYLLNRETIKPQKIDLNDSLNTLLFNDTELSKKERAVILATAQALIEQRESE